MTKRTVRQDVIRTIIRRGHVQTQSELAAKLNDAGHKCTQATVSRDISDLGLIKGKDGCYVLPEDRRLQNQVADMVESIEQVDCFMVIRTQPGSANSVCYAIDAAELEGVAGTIAGDDTIFCLCRGAQAAAETMAYINALRASGRN